ncbi:MAG: YciI family protein [Polyangiaceae bacterium]
MKYLLMLYADEKAGAQLPKEKMAEFMGQMYAYQDALKKAKAFISTNPLAPTNQASTVKVRGENAVVEDGPYAETQEQLGGYFVIEAADVEAAQQWAARCPAATWGTIEVRPILDLGGVA